MKKAFETRVFRDSDEKQLIALMRETFGFTPDYWIWKHRAHPNFNPSTIIVAEKDGKIIGSSSWIPRHLKISSSLATRAALGGDTAVDPNYRGKKVGSNIMKFFDTQLAENKIVVLHGFATQEVAKKFYAPLGSILIRDSTTTYIKFLNCDLWKEKVAALNQKTEELKAKLGRTSVKVRFILKGAPPFQINIKDGEVSFEEIADPSREKPDVIIQGELSLLVPFFQGEKRVFDLVKLVLRRKIKTKGVLRNFRKLLSTFRVIAPVFKSTN